MSNQPIEVKLKLNAERDEEHALADALQGYVITATLYCPHHNVCVIAAVKDTVYGNCLIDTLKQLTSQLEHERATAMLRQHPRIH